jgi:flagellar hook assembly protein FlgD
MRSSITLLLIATSLLLVSATAQARVSHGYSGIFSVDTVTAVGDDAAGLPQATTLATIYPNPFNPRTTIAFELAEAATIELAVFDLRGRIVRVLESGPLPIGRHQTIWDGQDDKGRAVPTGTYVCRLNTPQGSQTKKLTLAR